jgi:OOP family OmpA-OmpF porin
MNKTYLPIIAAGLLAAAPGAFAADSGWYLGANIGRSNFKHDSGAIDNALADQGFAGAASSISDHRHTGYKLYLGYQFDRHFALEGGYVDLGKLKFDSTTLGGSLSGNIKTKDGLFLDAVGIAPLNDRFNVFGKVGVYDLKTQLTASGTAGSVDTSSRKAGLNYGLGVGYKLTQHLGARLEWEQFHHVGSTDKTGRANVNLLSAGLDYHF